MSYSLPLTGSQFAMWVSRSAHNEPATTFGRRVSTWLVGLLPIKGEP